MQGVDGSVVFRKRLQKSKGAKGGNARTGEYEDLEPVIIDPTKD